MPVLLKRDDLAGTGLGGQQGAELEYLIADALGQGCDCLVTGGGPGVELRRWPRWPASRYQIEPHVVCYGTLRRRRGQMWLPGGSG